MPPFHPVASSAATRAVGTRKTIAGIRYSMMLPRPYVAIAGSERRLATTTRVRRASCPTPRMATAGLDTRVDAEVRGDDAVAEVGFGVEPVFEADIVGSVVEGRLGVVRRHRRPQCVEICDLGLDRLQQLGGK